MPAPAPRRQAPDIRSLQVGDMDAVVQSLSDSQFKQAMSQAGNERARQDLLAIRNRPTTTSQTIGTVAPLPERPAPNIITQPSRPQVVTNKTAIQSLSDSQFKQVMAQADNERARQDLLAIRNRSTPTPPPVLPPVVPITPPSIVQPVRNDAVIQALSDSQFKQVMAQAGNERARQDLLAIRNRSRPTPSVDSLAGFDLPSDPGTVAGIPGATQVRPPESTNEPPVEVKTSEARVQVPGKEPPLSNQIATSQSLIRPRGKINRNQLAVGVQQVAGTPGGITVTGSRPLPWRA